MSIKPAASMAVLLTIAAAGERTRAENSRSDMPLWTARGHLGWAEALAARGDADGAQDHARRALELSQGHGYGAFEPRAAAPVETESAAGT